MLVLLGLAGLLRPEAWLLGGAYWLYVAAGLPGRRAVGLAAVAAAPPLLWALSDLAVTGDPLHSLTFTRDTAETLGRPQGIENVPEIMPRRLGEILRWVPLVGGTAGFFLALRFARERALVPAALAVLGGLAFVAIGIAGLSLLGPLPVPAGRDAGRLLRLRGVRLARAAARARAQPVDRRARRCC